MGEEILSSEYEFYGKFKWGIGTWLSKMRGDKDMKGWLTHLYECVLTLNMSGAKRLSLLDRFFCYFGGSGEEGMGEDASYHYVILAKRRRH